MSAPPPDVRTGLTRVLREWPAWRTSPLVLLKNRLLDECGGDARPLINLVVRAAELGVHDRLLDWNRQGAPWSSVRGSIVVSLVSDAFLRPDMASWVTDSWGAALFGAHALGLAEEVLPDLQPRVGSDPRTARLYTTADATTTRPAAPRQSATRGSTSPRPVSPATPAPAGTATRPGTTPRATRSPVAMPSTRIDRIAIGALVVIVPLLIVSAVIRGRADTSTQQATGATASLAGERAMTGASGDGRTAVAETLLAGPQSSPLSQMSRNVLPNAPQDSAAIRYVRPPTRAEGAVGPGARILESRVALLQNSKADRLELRSGRSITGRVEVVRAGAILFWDAESGLRYEIPKGDIREITTEFGTKVRFNSDGDPTNERRSPLVMRGLAGPYRMRYELVGVQGSAECQKAPNVVDMSDQVMISHEAGADTLVLAVRNGSTWNAVVDKDGLFTSVLAIQPDQAQSSSVYTSRIAGRFTSVGFDAEVVLISYRRTQGTRDLVCQTTLRALGERQGAGAPAQR